MTITKKIEIKSFGIRDVAYTLDLDNLITRKPSIEDLAFEIEANHAGLTFNLSTHDHDKNKFTKRYTLTQNASNGTAIVYDKITEGTQYPSVHYTPNPNFVGEEVLKYRVTHDGTTALVDDDTASNPMSDEKTIIITVK